MKILLGDFGSGKSTAILKEAITCLKNKENIWIVVPSRHQKDALLLNIMQNLGVLVGSPILTFNDLKRKLNLYLPHSISNFEKFVIISSIIQRQEKKFRFFKDINKRPEIIKMIYRLISSLREQNIQVLPIIKLLEDKIHDLNLILESYRHELLQHQIYDQKLEIDILTENIQANKIKNLPQHIYIDGFIDFTPLQFKLLTTFIKYLEQQGTQVTMTLLSTDHTLCTNILHQIIKQFPNAEIKYLSSTCQNILSSSFLKKESIASPIKITEIQAFGRYKEVQEVANQIKKLCLFENYELNDILIITDQYNTYFPILTSIFNKFNLPFVFSKDELLSQNPLIIFIKKCLLLAQAPLTHETLDYFAQSNYIRSDLRYTFGQAAHLLPFPLQGNCEAWEEAIENHIHNDPENNDIEQLYRLKDAIQQLSNHFFILADHKEHSVEEYIRYIISILNFFGLQNILTNPSDTKNSLLEETINRDSAALDKLKEIFTELQSILAKIRPSNLNWKSFMFYFTAIIDETRYRLFNFKQNILRIVSADDARGLFAKTVFVLGMNESLFPSLPRHELFDNQDKNHLNQISKKILGKNLWQTDTDLLSKEKLMFASILSRATEQIFFSHTPIDEKGNYYIISNFLSNLLKYQTEFKRIPETNNTNSDPYWINPEIFLSKTNINQIFAHELIPLSSIKTEKNIKVEQIYQYIKNIAYANMQFDLDRSPPNNIKIFFGQLSKNSQSTMIYQGDIITISPTRLERLGRCRYQGLLQDIWKLKKRTLPQYTPKTADYGTLYHNILEQYLKIEPKTFDPLLLKTIIDEYISISHQEKFFRLDYNYIFYILSTFLQTQESQISQQQDICFLELQSGENPLIKDSVIINNKNFLIKSRIDRVNRDKISGNYHIIDYKKKGISSYKQYQKIPFSLFQGFIYGIILIENGFTPINSINYFFLEKNQKFEEIPSKIFPTISSLQEFKIKELIQLIDLVSEGNFSPFTLTEDLGPEIYTLFLNTFGDDFNREFQQKCRYCEVKDICLRKNKLFSDY
ncbi:ATP-dependent helicase/DNAse subunit B [Brevinema andersonii]|uniref:ATP-dependent helicase/DNAse subunit B n=1 Tax=Brevinema andersonii TaxID=34097 RepID=A0A1I1EUJ9_BREAD|nr:PD-(D/E)XK nuclease family protein [Brevinema andersonii]SFB90362.1 ATP-dependent helicase/DNAse subunit B [Brevinema andersonii]